ncbi:SRPBCC domain-containing protein [Asticcacaulis sp. 201]|uniref:SRPBCC domain-containing protein n=1 Tax=Asticcacaulis sp. 201 TaxID=3028787 RepID=UPI0029169071|nr:SRPBCC domain-containing protein [Asticcacaulis sp. 201]MDV6330573.1 SRPBCC domain-containing protein [Asticcacaulis sp. 201]
MSLKMEHRVGIAAPIDDVYDIVADIAAWPEWSPIHKKAEAVLRFGAPIHLEEYYEGLGTWETDGIIADWTPLSHIHVTVPKPFYAGKLIRYFEFDALSEAGTSFSLGALFDGYLSEREGRAYRRFIRTGFEAFCEALKAKAEAGFAEHPDRVASVIVKPDEAPKAQNKQRQKWLQTQFWGKKNK